MNGDSTTIDRPVLVATHPRSGTHATIDFLRRQFAACRMRPRWGASPHTLYLNLDHVAPTSSPHLSRAEAEQRLSRAAKPIIKTHCRPEFREIAPAEAFGRGLLEQATVLYIVRDGRDVLCSTQMWLWNQTPQARVSISAFLRQESEGRSRVGHWAEHVRAWTRCEKVHVMRYEDLIQRTSQTLSWLEEVLGVRAEWREPLLPSRPRWGGRWGDYLRRIRHDYRSSAIIGRPPGITPPRWRRDFSREDRAFFHEEAGEILMRYGYEESEAWIDPR